jgi:ABC-type multidrug transport system, ATPase and permease components
MTDQRAAQTRKDPPPIMGMGHGPGRGPMAMMGVPKERPKNTRETLKRLWGYLRRHRSILIVTSIMVIINAILNVIAPYLLGYTIDNYIIPGDLAGLLMMVLVLIGVHAAQSLITWVQTVVMVSAAQRTVRDIRNDLFRHLQKLPLRFFDQRPHGEVMSRLTNDVENVNQVLAEGVIQIVSGVVSMVGVAAIMLWVNPLLAIFSMVWTAGMTLVITRFIGPRTRVGFRAQQAALGNLNGLIEETVTGQRVVKAYHREPVVIEQFQQANLELRKAATRAQIFAGFTGPMMNFVNNTGLAVIGGIGGWIALGGGASVGTIASFITYSRQFGRPLNEIANLYNMIQSAIAGAERVFATIDEPVETDAPHARSLSDMRGEVIFENVDFSYTPGVPVLKKINLHAEPGQLIALVGPTGAGKTTIINLLTRFYEIDGGKVTIDGVDIRDLRKTDLRQQLGIVLQDTFLFSGTVMDNIRYGRLDASDDEVIAAAKLANADQFIHRLPNGYHTQLSERASNISQGQRQLLAIARAILANPRILILDEATSSVDTRTEQQIQEAMLRLMEGRTSFVIAHRLSTIRDADQILVINQGEVIERGTHESLLAANGFYARLYNSQFQSQRGSLNGATNESLAIETH